MLLTAVSAGFLGGWLGAGSRSDNQTNEASRQVISSESQLISDIARNVGPSVVSVNVTAQATVESFFGPNTVQRRSAGTGVIINADGVIITNRHVVPRGVTNVSVTLSDGTTLDNVEVIGRTAENDSLDVAFLRVKDKEGKELKAAALGDSSKMQVGDRVVAIGNALGQFQNTVTTGVLSGYGRNISAGSDTGSGAETLQNLFQTDAAINEGNSGGPLVNTSGEVIAINTAVAGQAENIGFAIPINDVQGLIKSVLNTGKLQRPYLGVRYASLTDDIAFELNLPIKRGAYILPARAGQPSILPDSPASKAGLREKDTIVKVNDKAIDDRNSLGSLLGQHSVGDRVTLTINREGKEQTLDATLEAAPTE